tara:strand:+ start:593 stop:1213 length:621 start_codon:yes stop_codon:yes gene_type:complete
MPPYIVCIDGNIGSGKSTLLDSLSDRGFKVYKEGIDKWTDVLENFYKDKSRWAFSLQVAILVDMYTKYKEASSLLACDIVFFERSPQSSLLFVQNSYLSGNISPVEYKHYMRLHTLLSWVPHKTFILDSSISTCFERIHKRQDVNIKTGLTKDYLTLIDTQYKSIQDVESLNGSLSVKCLTDSVIGRIQCFIPRNIIQISPDVFII